MSLLIPPKLIAGFNFRNDTLDGHLAFITYFNNDGTIFNAKRFDNWRNSAIPTMELTNEPRTGFTIGEHIQRSIRFGSGGDVYIRIYTPTQAEFEITLENFMELAAYAVIDKRYINAHCVLAWGKNGKISLLPIESPAYAEAVKYSNEYFSSDNEIKDFSNLQFGDMITEKKKSVSGRNFSKLYVGKHVGIDSERFTNLPKKSLIYDETTKKFSVNLPPSLESEKFIDLYEPHLKDNESVIQFGYRGFENIKLDPKKTYTCMSVADYQFKNSYNAEKQNLVDSLQSFESFKKMKALSENYLQNGYSFDYLEFSRNNIAHVLSYSHGTVFIKEDGSLLYVETDYANYQQSYTSYSLVYENKKFTIGEKLESGFLSSNHKLKVLAVQTMNCLYPIYISGKTLGLKKTSS